MRRTYAAVDLGSSSGRVMLGRVSEQRIELDEVRRFPNAPVHREDGWHWEVYRLWKEVLIALRKVTRAERLDGIAVDTWGVDYGRIGTRGDLIAEPFSYRDDRTRAVLPIADQRISPIERYQRTGCQDVPINTIYQLLDDQVAGRLDEVERFLLNPNLFALWLCGVAGADETIASTTQLFDPHTRDWNWPVIDAMRLPHRIFAPVVRTGTILGPVREDLGLPAGISVLNAVGHDTAAAYVAATGGTDQLVISIGTWSLVGAELNEPLITEQGRLANFTNEIGALGTIRFLSNAVGLWLIEECLREWRERGQVVAWEALIAAARSAPPFVSLFAPDDDRFMGPGPMVGRIIAAGDGSLTADHGAIVRSVLESLSLNHRLLLETAQSILGRQLARIRLVGGGSRNQLLCEMTADATGLPVLAGPAEATAIGNIAMQAIATGQIADLAAARDLIDRSFPPTRYDPSSDRSAWDAAYARWQLLIRSPRHNPG